MPCTRHAYHSCSVCRCIPCMRCMMFEGDLLCMRMLPRMAQNTKLPSSCLSTCSLCAAGHARGLWRGCTCAVWATVCCHWARPTSRLGARAPPLYLAASALPLPPATLPALGDAPELRSFHAHVAMAMHMAAACLRATADIGLHRQQRGGSRQNTPTDGTSASPGASAGA